MLVQNVQTKSLFASGIFSFSGEKTSGKAETGGLAFNDLFGGLTAGKTNIPTNEKVVAKDTDTVSVRDVVSKVQGDNSSDDGKNDIKSIADRINAKADKANAAGKALNETGTDAIDEAEIEKIGSCLVMITITVTEFFNVTPEELQGQMDMLGLDPSELADPDSMKQLFVAFECDGDISKLLTDQGLLDSFGELMDKITDVLENYGVSEEMIAATLENCFGSKDAFKLTDLTQESKADTEGEALRTVDDIEEAVEEKPVAEDENKELTIRFETENDRKADNGSGNKKNSTKASSQSDLADKFINNMIDRFRESVKEISGVENAAGLRGIANQILNQIKVNLTPDIKSLEIQLTPEHLGKVNVQIQENDGVITAKFHTENQMSKEAIESNIIQFKETLREQGLKVDSIEVTVSDFSFAKDQDAGKNNGGQNESKNKRHFSLDEINERVDKPDLMAQSYIDDGTSTVSYVA